MVQCSRPTQPRSADHRARRLLNEGMMRMPIATSLILIAILLGSMQTSSVAGDCYFNSTTLEPPDFARCYSQQSVSPTRTESSGYRERRGRLINRQLRHMM
jgi:hypothetical protein